MIGQMLCFLMPRKATEEQIEKIVSYTKAGSFFISANGQDEIKQCTKIIEKHTKLLKGELGFKGCIVSDALSMIGASSVVPHDRLAVEFVKAGGDMLLFPLPEYFDQIKAAVLSGEIPTERIRDAVRRVIEMKKRMK